MPMNRQFRQNNNAEIEIPFPERLRGYTIDQIYIIPSKNGSHFLTQCSRKSGRQPEPAAPEDRHYPP